MGLLLRSLVPASPWRRREIQADLAESTRYDRARLGQRALYVGGPVFWEDHYIPLEAVTRIFKRVAETTGGFYGRLSYLVLAYQGGEKQCLFRDEAALDALLLAVRTRCPEIPVGKV